MDTPPEHEFKIRIKLPDGAELEAAGTRDFVTQEKNSFLNLNLRAAAAPPHEKTQEARDRQAGPAGPADWREIAERKGGAIQLRAKLPAGAGDKDACLILLAAAQHLLNIAKPTAAQLAKWLRASGYPVQRVDRTLAQALKTGDILASGSRRARRYELSGPGRVKAFLLSERLADLIAGRLRTH